jgi:hypothetical protein
MKTPLLIFALLLAGINLQARMVTLTTNGNPGSPTRTNEMILGPNESIEAVGWYPGAIVNIIKDGITFIWGYDDRLGVNTQTPLPHVLAGPALVRVISYDSQAYVTFKITPESFPPDKTVVIPQGQGANIIMECSTNLIDWTVAAPGVYTNVPSAKFFRIRPERVP